MLCVLALSIYTQSCIHIQLFRLHIYSLLACPILLFFFPRCRGEWWAGRRRVPPRKNIPPKMATKNCKNKIIVPTNYPNQKQTLAKSKRNSQQQILHFSKVGFSDKPLAIEYQWITDFTFRVCFALTSHLTCDIL